MTLNKPAVIRREKARQSDGKFGTQPRPATPVLKPKKSADTPEILGDATLHRLAQIGSHREVSDYEAVRTELKAASGGDESKLRAMLEHIENIETQVEAHCDIIDRAYKREDDDRFEWDGEDFFDHALCDVEEDLNARIKRWRDAGIPETVIDRYWKHSRLEFGNLSDESERAKQEEADSWGVVRIRHY